MAIWVSGQQVELREVVLKDKPLAMLEVSPKGTVPVLVLPDGKVLDESLDIMSWALRCDDPKNWMPTQPDDMKRIFSLIEQCDGDFKHHLDRYKYASRYEGADALEHRAEAAQYLSLLDQELTANRYLGGAEANLADYAIMPFVRQFANTDSAWFSAAPLRNLRRWLEELLATEPFVSVMAKYPQWHEGDEVTLFPA